jgi:magnesium chelatase subunit D
VSGYPFAALVGQDDLRLALQLAAVDPRIGGVLIRGERGTAKSTAARGLAELLPDAPDRAARFVELPLGASDDRITGALDLGRTLASGEPAFASGLLSGADGGVLYIDEVNLLADHLVDLLLDTTASGELIVERDGFSLRQPARFVLVATMNPEEGDLRPQLIDRFAFAVTVRGIADASERTEIVRRRLAFERDPDRFRLRFSAATQSLRDEIARAKELLPRVRLDDIVGRAIELALDAGAAGHRAEITLVRAAAANAALRGADIARVDDLDRVAELVLSHRRTEEPDAGTPPPPPSTTGSGTGSSGNGARQPVPVELGRFMESPRPHLSGAAPGPSPLGPTNRGRSSETRGKRVDLAATLRAAVARTGSLRLTAGDLRFGRSRSAPRALQVLVVDASRSMTAERRLAVAKGALIRAATRDVRRRNRFALIAFGGATARIVVPPTPSRPRLIAAIRALDAGGSTPLVAGVNAAAGLVARWRRSEADDAASVVIVTDARAELDGLSRVAADLRRLDARVVVVDAERSRGIGRASALARLLGAELTPLETGR